MRIFNSYTCCKSLIIYFNIFLTSLDPYKTLFNFYLQIINIKITNEGQRKNISSYPREVSSHQEARIRSLWPCMEGEIQENRSDCGIEENL